MKRRALVEPSPNRRAADDQPINARTLRDLRRLLAEDLGTRGDITSRAVLRGNPPVTAHVLAMEDCVLAGLPYAQELFRFAAPGVHLQPLIPEGHRVEAGEMVATVTGPANALFAVERTALNLLGRLSGVATLTRRYVDEVEGTRATLLDTRKTMPGLRELDKYAVRHGGGTNHRLNLSEQVLIKTNHLRALGLARQAAIRIALSRAKAAGKRPIELEVTTSNEVRWGLENNADLLLLDNMRLPQIRTAVALRNRTRPKTQLEVSGGVNLRNVRAIAKLGVERISVGAITKHARMLDFSLRVQ